MTNRSRALAPFGEKTLDLYITNVDVVRVLRPEAEIPHHLRRGLRIVRIEQRERQPRNVVIQFTFIIEPNLGGVFLGRGLVWRRPFQVSGRHDLHPHPLFDQHQIPGANEVGHRRGIIRSNKVAGFDGSITSRRNECRCDCSRSESYEVFHGRPPARVTSCGHRLPLPVYCLATLYIIAGKLQAPSPEPRIGLRKSTKGTLQTRVRPDAERRRCYQTAGRLNS